MRSRRELAVTVVGAILISKLVNIVAFQTVWFASVLGAANGWPWLGTLCLAPFLVWQLSTSRDPTYDRNALLLMGAAGLIVDSAYPLAGVASYASPWPSPRLAPVWLLMMWLNLALTMNQSLAWLRGRYLLAALFGGLGGGLSYWAGWRLGAVEFLWPPWAAACLIGLVWAILLPLAYAFLERSAPISTESAQSPR